MKKAKIASIVVIMLSVIALGVFMGKQMFKLMEAETGAQGQSLAAQNATSTVKILYSANKNDNTAVTAPAQTPATAQTVETAAKPVETEKAKAKEPEKDKISFDPDGPKWVAYASGNGINVRSGSSLRDKALFKVAKGTKGTVLGKENGWTHIKWDFNKKDGWVRDDLLIQGPATIVQTVVANTSDIAEIDANKINKATAKAILAESNVAVAIAKPAPVSETVKSFIDSENLPEQARIEVQTFANIRSGPSTRHDMVAKLPKGMVVKIKAVEKVGKWQWFEIIFQNGRKTGWTREDNLRF